MAIPTWAVTAPGTIVQRAVDRLVPHPTTCTCLWGGTGHIWSGSVGSTPRKDGVRSTQTGLAGEGTALAPEGGGTAPEATSPKLLPCEAGGIVGPGQRPHPRDPEGRTWLSLPDSCSSGLSLLPEPSLCTAATPPKGCPHCASPSPRSDPCVKSPGDLPFHSRGSARQP